MIVKEIVEKTAAHFRKLGFEKGRFEAEVLISHALGWKRIDLYLKSEYPMNESEIDLCRQVVMRRSRGEPVAYIQGEKEFYSLPFKIQPGVLIPRPDTEHIVDRALAYCREKNFLHPKVLDLGVGSGCIGLSILKNLPEAFLLGFDISSTALDCARENAKNLQLESRSYFEKIDVSQLNSENLQNDLFKDFDLLVANPPYISRDDKNVQESVLRFEPSEALFADADGLQAYQTWLQRAAFLLKPGALCLIEIGATQADPVSKIIASFEIYEKIKVHQDYAGLDRVIEFYKK